LLSLGGKTPMFSNTSVDNDMFRWECRIILEGSSTLNTSGKTNIQGDVKNLLMKLNATLDLKQLVFWKGLSVYKLKTWTSLVS
jgi:hypothetical protein